ncbi:MAG: lysophospholipid acyltransferase family protein [Polyangiaceae bacterium]|nr:lysophospholipid acyltransferase family protein [Polyangiaceae bacterium]MCL4751281.1 lysophospholipid acyltransferase family protein [Myxococcales bacterium]
MSPRLDSHSLAMARSVSRDLRLGGHWRWGQRLKNGAIRLCVIGLLGLADRLPERLLYSVCRAVGRLVYWTAPSLVRRARERVGLALPDAEVSRVVRECFLNAGTTLATSLLLRRPNVKASALVAIDAPARELLAGAGGAVVVSAHLGPFELVAPAVAELGLPTAIVVRESYDPALDAHVDAHRRARGVTVIHRGDPGAGARIVRALRSGQLVGVLPDLPARVESARVDFLGTPSEMPIGPARIALAAGVPLLAACLAPLGDGRRFRLEVSRIDPAGLSATTLTQRVANALSRAILLAPAWWLWMAAKGPGDLEKKRSAR